MFQGLEWLSTCETVVVSAKQMLPEAKEPYSQPMELVVSGEPRDTSYVHILVGKQSMIHVEWLGLN